MVFDAKDARDDKGLNAIPHLNGHNYSVWESMMTLFLNSRGLLNVCTTVPVLPESEEAKSMNAITLFHIASTIDKLIYNSVFKLNPGATAYKIWNILKDKYAKRSVFSTGRVWRQWDKILCTGTLMDYIERTCDCLGEFKNIGIDVTHEIFAACIISRVTEAKPLLMETLAADEETVSDSFRLLEKLRGIATHELNTIADDTTHKKSEHSAGSSTALASGSFPQKRKKVEKEDKDWECTNGRHDPNATHSRKKCWEENPHLKPKRFRPSTSNVTTAKATVTQTAETQPQQSTSTSDDVNDNAVPSFAYGTGTQSSMKIKLTAILDSGASSHMLNSLDFFIDTKPVYIFVITGDGKTRKELVATKIGTALIQVANNKIITLKNALYVENLTRNLVSFSQLLDEKVLIKRQKQVYEVISNDNDKLFNLNLTNQLFEIDGDISPVYQKSWAMVKTTDNLSGFTKWHNRLGHASKDRLKVVVPEGENLIKDKCCDSCMKGKMTRKSFKHHFDKTTEVLEVVHGDLVGPITPTSNGGGKYFLTLVDQDTGFINITILKEKSDTPDAINKFKIFYENQTGKRIKKLITDGGGEFCNKTLSSILEANGIQHNVAPPYNPQQNGIAERANRTILDMTRCILLHSKMASEWWAEAVKTSCAMTNCLPTLSKGRQSPIELLFGKKPNVQIFRPFGCKVWALKPEVYHERKFDSLAWEGILIGYSNDYSTYKVLRVDDRKIINIKHVHFEEDIFPGFGALHKSQNNLNLSNDQLIFHQSESLPENNADTSEETDDDYAQKLFEEEVSSEKETSEGEKIINSSINAANILNYSRRTALMTGTPKTHNAAMKSDEIEDWKKAEQKEYQNMKDHDAWLVRMKKAYDSPIASTWAFRKKLGANNEVVEFKARICAQGFRQTYGFDYHAKYAPTGKPASLRLLMSFAINNDLKIHQLDVRSAFLTCPLEDKVTLLPPPGYEGPQNTVFELKKAVYGLRQAPLVWYKRLSTFLKSIQFNISVSDPCVFWRAESSGRPSTWIYIHVDDLVIISKDPLIFKNEIEKEFAIKYMGDAEFLLGMNIIRKEDSVTINQLQYVERKLVQFNLQNEHLASCPLDPKGKMNKATQEDQDALKKLGYNYRSIVGSLNYLSILTRPDISYAVSALSQFLESPGLSHYNAAIQVFRYISGTREMGLTFKKEKESELKAYVDADWGNCLVTRRSVTGYVAMAGNHLLSWKSSKQDTVSLSSAEAEYKALSNLSREIIWISSLVNETQVLKSPTQIMVYVDNKAAIDLANSETAQNGFRTKHMDIRLHFVREHIQSKLLKLKYIKSNNNPADFLTKPVGRCTIKRSLQVLNVSYQSKSTSNLTTQSTQECWNAHSGTNPRKRRAQSGCSLIELQNNKRVVCGSRSDVRDVKKLIEHDQRSSNFNFVTPNSNSSKLLDRISTPFIGSSENHQL
ncbi:hypothetical protein MJO29_002020 [Puccinia striiformis f. sp. tritici]|nr:hypothetical protein MJO29_002020 [Puccinia striiformis f. sp. tritici]